MIGIAFAPHDQGRVPGQVQAILGAHHLPGVIDHRPQLAHEGAPALRVRQGRVRLPALGEARRPDALALEPPAHGLAAPQHEPRERDGKHGLGTREGERPEQRAHVPTEPAARDQDHALAQLRKLVGELQRNATAQRVAHQRGPVDAQGAEQVSEEAGVRAEGVVAPRLRGHAVAGKVRRQHPVPPGQPLHRLVPGPGVAGDPVDQEQGLPLALEPVGDVVPVKGQVVNLEHGGHRRDPSALRRPWLAAGGSPARW